MNPRVAILLTSSSHSGKEKRAINLFKVFADTNEHVYLVANRRLESYISKVVEKELWERVIYLEKPNAFERFVHGNRSWRLTRRLLGLDLISAFTSTNSLEHAINILRPDVIHAFSPYYLPKARRGISVMYEVTSPDVVANLKVAPRVFIKKIKLFNCVSDSVHDLFLENFGGVPATKDRTALFLPKFSYNLSERYCEKENIIVYAHRLIERKNPVAFVKAALEFLKRNESWKVEIYGKGPLAKDVGELISKSGLEKRCVLSYSENLESALIRSKIFVSIIESDNYPSQSVIEAMWAGNAVLLSNKGRTGERFYRNNGEMIDVSESNITSALERLCLNAEKLKGMGIRSRDLVDTEYSIEGYATDTMQKYFLCYDDGRYSE